MRQMMGRRVNAFAPVRGGDRVGTRRGGPLSRAVGRGREIVLQRGSAAVAHDGAGWRSIVPSGATAARGVTVMRRGCRDARGASVASGREHHRTSIDRRRRSLGRKFRLQRRRCVSSLRHRRHLHSRRESRVHESLRSARHALGIATVGVVVVVVVSGISGGSIVTVHGRKVK